MADPGFPDGGTNSRGEKNCRKLHKNLDREGARLLGSAITILHVIKCVSKEKT